MQVAHAIHSFYNDLPYIYKCLKQTKKLIDLHSLQVIVDPLVSPLHCSYQGQKHNNTLCDCPPHLSASHTVYLVLYVPYSTRYIISTAI